MSPNFDLTLLLWLIPVLLLVNLGLGLWLLRLSRHYNSLFKGVEPKSLTAAIEGIQKTLAAHERGLAAHSKDLQSLHQSGQLHLQNLRLHRFNPFSDTGGDQSFVLSLLDGNRDGVVITSLHSRENTRFYIKEVEHGEGKDHSLSKEEQKVVK